MVQVSMKVNGKARKAQVEPRTLLIHFLREQLNLTGAHVGCDTSQCGACTVLLDNQAVRSCIQPMSTLKNREVVTLEGLAKNGTLHPLQQAWIEEQVPQCGFCQNGQILTAKALLDRTPNPTDAQIRQGMNGTLCRCMTYYRVQAAIKRAVKAIASADTTPEVTV